MRAVVILSSLALALAAAVAAFAQRPEELPPFAEPLRDRPSPSDAMLFQPPTAAALRARLLDHADAMAAVDTFEAGRALAYRGRSFARDGEPDSAVAAYERAFRLDPRPQRRMELSEVLFMRLAHGDAERAREILRPIQPATPELPEMSAATVQGSFAWAHYLAGNADSAALLFGPVETWLSTRAEWRYRMACVALDRSEWQRVILLLQPLAVASRTFDSDVMDLMKRAGEAMNIGRHIVPSVSQDIGIRERGENALLAEWGARRVKFLARDGSPLGGVLLAPAGPARSRAAIVLVAQRDTLADYDSLAVGLRRMGLAVMLLEPRGSGHSVDARCPLPDSWRGRENVMQARCAGDAREALRAMAREAAVDTTRYLLVGVGASAPIAAEAARLDRRAAVMMLVSPEPEPVDRGPMRATLAALKLPVYYQTAPGDFTTWGLIDTLYRSGDVRASRVSEYEGVGRYAALFRRDPKILARFKLWLAESWPRPTAPRATPRPRPRTG